MGWTRPRHRTPARRHRHGRRARLGRCRDGTGRVPPRCRRDPRRSGGHRGLATPLGFAYLAAITPQERLGQTMGAAEVGRELDDAGGPLLVGVIAVAATLSAGFAGLAVLLVVAGVAAAGARSPERVDDWRSAATYCWRVVVTGTVARSRGSRFAVLVNEMRRGDVRDVDGLRWNHSGFAATQGRPAVAVGETVEDRACVGDQQHSVDQDTTPGCPLWGIRRQRRRPCRCARARHRRHLPAFPTRAGGAPALPATAPAPRPLASPAGRGATTRQTLDLGQSNQRPRRHRPDPPGLRSTARPRHRTGLISHGPPSPAATKGEQRVRDRQATLPAVHVRRHRRSRAPVGDGGLSVRRPAGHE